MLVINRTIGESILIGVNLRVTILNIQGKQIHLGFDDPEKRVTLPSHVLKLNEKINLRKDLSILVVQIRGKQARLGIHLPPGIKILRGEILAK